VINGHVHVAYTRHNEVQTYLRKLRAVNIGSRGKTSIYLEWIKWLYFSTWIQRHPNHKAHVSKQFSPEANLFLGTTLY